MNKLKKAVDVLKEHGPLEVGRRLRHKVIMQKEKQKLIKTAQELHVISEKVLEEQRREKFSGDNVISIITPLYNTPPEYLVELIRSVQEQTCGQWELCLADGSDAEHAYVQSICMEKMKKDARIRYKKLISNDGISANTNECISLAEGNYLGLLDHDDILHVSAVYEVMCAIEKKGADFIYSDETKFAGKPEEASDFNFKPDYGKDELRAHNYICHFTVFSRKLLDTEETLYRKEFDGSQDHDMVLRLTEKAKKIVHIPKILYYWRVHENSVSMNLSGKSYAVDAAIRAVGEQLERTGETGSVSSNLPYQTIYRIRYDLKEKSLISIIVCHTEKTDETEFENQIREATHYTNIEFCHMYPERDKQAEAWNEAVHHINGKYFILLSADGIPVTPDWVEELLMYAQRTDVCAVSPKVLWKKNLIYYAGISLDIDSAAYIKVFGRNISVEEQGYEAMLRHVRNVTAAWDGCVMIRREVFENLGGFSTDMPGYEVIDFCLRGREMGYWNVWNCFSEMRYEGKENVYSEKSQKIFYERWKTKICDRDEFYNPNLKKLTLV